MMLSCDGHFEAPYRTLFHALLVVLLHLFPALWHDPSLLLSSTVPLTPVHTSPSTSAPGSCFRRAQTTRAQVHANVAHLLLPSAPLGASFAGHPYAFTHSVVDAACPRYVMALQNENAGAGHRVREWAMGVWASVLFNLTLVHWPLLNERLGLVRDGLKPEHKLYAGWDDMLGLALAENRSLTYYEVSARRDKQQLRELNVGGFQLKRFTVPNVEGELKWSHLGDPSACNMLYLLPGNNWVYDLSGPIRGMMQYKFLHAPQRPEWAKPLFSPAVVNVAVHFRRGDMVPTSEFTLWRIVDNEVLPAFQLAGLRARVHVHVFADSGANASDFTIFPKHYQLGEQLFFHFLEDPVVTMYNLAHSDIFVGSRSSFSWLVALVSSQPYCLMQTMDPMHEFCPAGSGCCTSEGECVSAGRALSSSECLAEPCPAPHLPTPLTLSLTHTHHPLPLSLNAEHTSTAWHGAGSAAAGQPEHPQRAMPYLARRGTARRAA